MISRGWQRDKPATAGTERNEPTRVAPRWGPKDPPDGARERLEGPWPPTVSRRDMEIACAPRARVQLETEVGKPSS